MASSGALRATVMSAASAVDDNAKEPNGSAARHESGQSQNDAVGHFAAPSYTLFFYGTLVHPAILSRMVGHAGANLIVQPAILDGYVLHHVKGEDYPALVTREQSKIVLANLAQSTPPPPVTAVRGTVVQGLTDADVRKLDLFEGDEYIRTAVEALSDPSIPALTNEKRPRDADIGQILASLTPEHIDDILANPPKPQPCHVYRWQAPITMLEPQIWAFETFMSSGNHHKWWAS